MWMRRHVLPYLGNGQTVAVRFLVGGFVEMRHFGPWPAARDHLDQMLAVQEGFAEIGGSSGRARVATTIAIWSVAELTIRLFLVKPLAKRNVLGSRRASQ